MPTLIDARFNSLRAQGFTGALQDMILQWLHAYGATSNNVNDAWKEVLVSRGYDADTYQWNDAWFTILGDLGYDQKTLNGREYAFWAAGGNTGNWQFVFNGVDQYATMLGWAAQGKPRRYKFSFTANAVATGTEQHILSGTEGGVDLNFYLHATLPVLSIQYRNEAGGQAIEEVLDAADEIVAGTNYDVEVINLGTGSEILINGNPVDLTTFAASDGLQPPLTHIGAKHDVTGFFGGVIKTALLQDDSPIHDTYANMGDDNRYGELEQSIVLDGDFEIEWDNIADTSGGVVVIGDTENNHLRYRLDLNRFDIVIGGGTNQIFSGVGLADGQHHRSRFTRIAGRARFYVDDVQIDTDNSNIFPWRFSLIGTSTTADASARLRAGKAYQNIIIKDLDNNYTWNYPLDEGPTTDTRPELISGAPTTIGGLVTWDGSTLHLEGTNSSGTFEGAGVVDGGDYHVTFDYNTSAANTYLRIGGGANLAVIPGPAVGTYDEVLSAQGTGYVLNIASDNNSGDFTNFSVKSATGGGIIHNTDPSTQGNYQNLPFYDTDALIGNGARYIEMPAFVIGESEDFEITFDSIYVDMGSNNYVVLGNSVAAWPYSVVRMDGATASNPKAIGMYLESDVVVFLGALTDVDVGQYFNATIRRVGSSLTCVVDGGPPISGSLATLDTVTFDQIGRGQTHNKWPAGTTFQNVILENLTTGEAIGYKINEGSGLDVIAYDIVNGEFGAPVPAKNGTITPDASWEYIPEYSNNGAWTPDTDWTFIPDNSRFYPMSGGPDGGATMACRDGNNQLTPANDATIQNYTDNWERPS